MNTENNTTATLKVVCDKCGEHKPLTEFYSYRRRGAIKYRTNCKICHMKAVSTRKANNTTQKLKALFNSIVRGKSTTVKNRYGVPLFTLGNEVVKKHGLVGSNSVSHIIPAKYFDLSTFVLSCDPENIEYIPLDKNISASTAIRWRDIIANPRLKEIAELIDLPLSVKIYSTKYSELHTYYKGGTIHYISKTIVDASLIFQQILCIEGLTDISIEDKLWLMNRFRVERPARRNTKKAALEAVATKIASLKD